MKNKFLKITFLTVVSVSFLSNKTNALSAKSLTVEEKLEKIKIGDSKEKVIAIWGDKAEESTEKYDSKTIQQLNYSNAEGRPEASFSVISNSNQILGKAIWVYREKAKSNLEDKLKGRFKNLTWQTYTPCHTRSDKDKILVNHEQGITLDIGGNGIALISWSSPELLQMRINLIMKTCPKLQNRSQSGIRR